MDWRQCNMTKLQLNKNEYADISDNHLIEALGILPIWVREWATLGKMAGYDIIQYMTAAYGFGDLFEFKGGEILEDGTYRYPEDPDLPWIGKMDTPNGTAYFYESAMLALPMPDGKHYITRMD